MSRMIPRFRLRPRFQGSLARWLTAFEASSDRKGEGVHSVWNRV
jgi:hypothetical protein